MNTFQCKMVTAIVLAIILVSTNPAMAAVSTFGWTTRPPIPHNVTPQEATAQLVGQVIDVLYDAELHGLDGLNYGRPTLIGLADQLDASTLTDAEIEQASTTARQALLGYLADLRFGFEHGESEDVDLLRKSVNHAQPGDDVATLVAASLPHHSQYVALQAHLAELWSVQADGGWPTIGDGTTMQLGDSGERVLRLKQRLGVSDDSETYDETLSAAVERYQSTHGLEADGLAGRRTITHLDIGVAYRIVQVKMNLARWRQTSLPSDGTFVHVNVPEYQLRYVRAEQSDLTMRVIVGETDNPTPVFSDEIEYLVFSPYWNVPRSITVNELLPKFARDPESLSRSQYEVIGKNGVVPVDSLDFANVEPASFPYRIRQKPGRQNSLGKVKFIFPNSYSVYLHDTPADSLFSRSRRALSHGCVRLEDPELLAAALLDTIPDWSIERVQTAMEGNTPDHVSLPEPVPVHITYFTAATTNDGRLRLLDDVYELDAIGEATLASVRHDLQVEPIPVQVAMSDAAL